MRDRVEQRRARVEVLEADLVRAALERRELEQAVDEVKEQSDISDEDEKVQQAGRDLKAFVEKLSGKSLDDLTSAVQTVSSRIFGRGIS